MLCIYSSLKHYLVGLNMKSGPLEGEIPVNTRYLFCSMYLLTSEDRQTGDYSVYLLLRSGQPLIKANLVDMLKLQRIPSMRAIQREDCLYQKAISRDVMNSFYFLFFSDPADIIIEYTCTCLSFHP